MPQCDLTVASRWSKLLVVVSIIALLIAILLPSLKQAREQGKLAACASNLRQIGTGVHTYANEAEGLIPRGPDPAHPFDFGSNILATNQIWIGAGSSGPPPTHPRRHNALGTLLASTLDQPRVYFCPADDNFNLIEELPKVGTDEDAYGSYLYRQLDHLPADAGLGKLRSVGRQPPRQCRGPGRGSGVGHQQLRPGRLRPHQPPGPSGKHPLS